MDQFAVKQTEGYHEVWAQFSVSVCSISVCMYQYVLVVSRQRVY